MSWFAFYNHQWFISDSSHNTHIQLVNNCCPLLFLPFTLVQSTRLPAYNAVLARLGQHKVTKPPGKMKINAGSTAFIDMSSTVHPHKSYSPVQCVVHTCNSRHSSCGCLACWSPGNGRVLKDIHDSLGDGRGSLGTLDQKWTIKCSKTWMCVWMNWSISF